MDAPADSDSRAEDVPERLLESLLDTDTDEVILTENDAPELTDGDEMADKDCKDECEALGLGDKEVDCFPEKLALVETDAPEETRGLELASGLRDEDRVAEGDTDIKGERDDDRVADGDTDIKGETDVVGDDREETDADADAKLLKDTFGLTESDCVPGNEIDARGDFETDAERDSLLVGFVEELDDTEDLRVLELNADAVVDRDTTAEILTDVEPDVERDVRGLADGVGIVDAEDIGRDDGIVWRDLDCVKLGRGLRETEEVDIGEALIEGEGDSDNETLGETDGVEKMLDVNDITGDFDAVDSTEKLVDDKGEREDEGNAEGDDVGRGDDETERE
jgi:hypothetical protein